MDRTVLPPHVAISSFGNKPHGFYSTKARNDRGADVMGKVVDYTPSPYTARTSELPKRDAYKGKQLLMSHRRGATFGKVEYQSAPYEDKGPKKNKGKLGFGSSRPFGRDEASTMLDTIRYRAYVESEKEALAASALASSARFASTDMLPGRAGETLGSSAPPADASARFAASGAPAAGHGSGSLGASLAGRLPQLRHTYDQVRHKEEFVPHVSYQERYARDYGSFSPSSSAIGVGCADVSVIVSPTHPKGDFTHIFDDKGHQVVSSIGGFRM